MAVYHNNNGDLELIAGSTNYQFCPIGSILPFGGVTAPNGFFLCQGQALSRTDYKELFDVIGTRFGSGDGSTTFNLPDLRGEFLRGAGANSHAGQGNGSAVGTHQDATKQIVLTPWANQLYFETGAVPSNFDTMEYGPTYQYLQNEAGHTGAQEVYRNMTARPTNTSVNYIIKAKVVNEGDSGSSDPGYSTSEIDTGKVWINGKKIYRKVLTSTTPATGNETYPSNAINETIYIGSTCDTILDISGYIQYANNVSGMINVPTSSSQWVLLWGRGNGHSTMPNSLGIAVGTDAVNLPITIIVEYTK